MTTPVFKVAVRDDSGQAAMSRGSHYTIHTHEQVRELVQAEIPGVAVILVGIG